MSELTDKQVHNLAKLAEKAPEVLEMLETFERSQWLGGFLFKCFVWVGGAIAAVATFKQQIIALFGK